MALSEFPVRCSSSFRHVLFNSVVAGGLNSDFGTVDGENHHSCCDGISLLKFDQKSGLQTCVADADGGGSRRKVSSEEI